MDQQIPDVPAPRPPAKSGTVPLAVFLVLVIAGASGAAYIQYRSARARANSVSSPQAGMSAPGAGAATVADGMPGGGASTTIGEGTAVVVDTALSPCATPISDMLTQVGKEHGDAVTVHLNQMGTPEAVKGTGGTCAGYVVRAKDESGELKEVARFEKSPEAAGWTQDQLKQAILDAIDKAPKSDKPADTGTATQDSDAGKSP